MSGSVTLVAKLLSLSVSKFQALLFSFFLFCVFWWVSDVRSHFCCLLCLLLHCDCSEEVIV
uniref:Uncharacterized protein n=1 Tax=Anguilla anguilla TaxID=7936 RepID=A0A0E9TRC6_ANGAN